jgi:hypothetical protein
MFNSGDDLALRDMTFSSITVYRFAADPPFPGRQLSEMDGASGSALFQQLLGEGGICESEWQ